MSRILLKKRIHGLLTYYIWFMSVWTTAELALNRFDHRGWYFKLFIVIHISLLFVWFFLEQSRKQNAFILVTGKDNVNDLPVGTQKTLRYALIGFGVLAVFYLGRGFLLLLG